MKGNKMKKLLHHIKVGVKAFKDDYNNTFNTAEVVMIIFISIFFGAIIGCLLTYNRTYLNADSKTRELISAYQTIKDNYYTDLSDEDLVNAAVSGMASILDDPNSYYMGEEDTLDFNQRLDGSFEGIGISIYHTDLGNVVFEVYKNSPAAKAGIKANDRITQIDGKDVSNISLEDLTGLIRKKGKNKIKIKVIRDDKEMEFVVARGRVELTSVTNKIVEGENRKIGYINISIFAANTYEQFRKSLKSLEKQEIDSLIIDVRDNPGGHLGQAEDILSLFFDKKTVLYQLDTKGKIENKYASTSEKRSYDVVILVNEGTASASEILASCFKDNYKKAKLVGTTTYGKGTIQNALELSTGSTIKYTIQKWRTSRGEWINEVGIKPDIEVTQSEEYFNCYCDEEDDQLQKALDLLTKKES